MKIALALSTILAFQSLANLPLTTLRPDAEELILAFNQASDELRLITVWSPT